MSLVDLRAQLGHLKTGEKTVIPYDLYSDLFPAGEPDQIIHSDSYHFAKANSCHIENRPSQQVIWVIKDAKKDRI